MAGPKVQVSTAQEVLLAPSGGVDITGGTIRPAAGINKDVWRTICQRAGLLFPVFLDQIRIGAYCVGTISLKIEFFSL